MEYKSAVSELLNRARRRCFIDVVLDQSALAVSIAMAGAIVLLLAGTQLLEWYWVALLAIASLGIGIYRFARKIPSTYKLAQRIDRRLNLADALSTATYFGDHEVEGREAVRAQQQASAESIARTVDPRVAVPFTRSRFVFPAAGLALIAGGLFAVRYAATGSMSLEPSLVKMAFDTFFGSPQQQAKNNHGKRPEDLKASPLDPGSPDAPTTQADQAPDAALDTVDTPDVNNPLAADEAKSAAQQGRQQNPPEDAKGEEGEKGDKSAQGNDTSKDDSPQGADKSKDGKQSAKNDSSKQGGENSSMLDKLKDAMSNMLNKMKGNPPKEGQQSAQNQDSKSGGQEKGNQKGSQSQKGAQSESSDADAQSDSQGDKNDQKQTADAKTGDKSKEKSSSPEGKSGIGSSDGDKSAKEAEQLDAMGKISEILGKRSQNVTGEVMVEVGSTKQQLKTPWAQKQAQHVEAGSEIHRDEVPLMYQQFVQQYFEEIRKSPDAGSKPATKTGDQKPAPKTPGPVN